MKCLSVRQPYAALNVAGLKQIETRSWPTSHRGRILIHASLRPHRLPVDLEPVLSQVPDELLGVRGVILGEATISECRLLVKEDRAAALCEINPNWYAWVLTEPRIFESFRTHRGQLGLVEVPWPM